MVPNVCAADGGWVENATLARVLDTMGYYLDRHCRYLPIGSGIVAIAAGLRLKISIGGHLSTPTSRTAARRRPRSTISRYPRAV